MVEEVVKLDLVDRFSVERKRRGREKEEQFGKWHAWHRTSSRLCYRLS